MSEKAIKTTNEYLIDLNPPKNLSKGNSDIVKMEKGFEKLVIHMEEMGVYNPKKLSVYEFYSRVDFLESKINPNR